MWTVDDFKRDREKQILAFGIVFFLLSFPLYFSSVAGDPSSDALGGTGLYEVGGEISFVELDSGMEYVISGETWTIDGLSTDSIDGADDMNIVGVLVTLSYGEDEENSGGPTCTGPLWGSSRSRYNQWNCNAWRIQCFRQVVLMTMLLPRILVESLWYNDSMVGEIVLLSESEIMSNRN